MLILGQFASYLLSAVGLIFVATFLGSYNLGEVTVVMIPASVAILLNDFGVNNALTRYISQYRFEKKNDRVKKLLEAGFLFNIVSMSLSSALVYLLADQISAGFLQTPELSPLVRVAAFYVFGQGLLTMAQAVFVGFDMMGMRSFTLVIWSLFKAIFPPILVWIGFGPFGAVMGSVLSSILVGIFGMLIVFFLWRSEGDGDGFDLWSALRLLLVYGFPLYLASLFTGGLNQFYSILMTLYVEKDLIGNYNVAVNFGIMVSLFSIPISTALFPLFSKMNTRRDLLGSLFQRVVKYTAMITTPVALYLILFSDIIVGIVYPTGYPYASFYMKFYLVMYLFQGIGAMSVNSLLDGIGETRIHLNSNVLTLIFGIPLSLLLIPKFGIPGMLITMIIAPRVGLVYELIWIKRNLSIGFDAKSSFAIYLSAGLAAAITAIPLYLLSVNRILALLFTTPVFFLFYIVLILLSDGLTKKDLQELGTITPILGPIAPLAKLILREGSKICRH